MDDYPLLNLFWTMLLLFVWVLWFFMLIKVLTDIFRSNDLSGWAKAGWTLFVIVLPFLGVLSYLVVRGASMAQREAELARQSEDAFRSYIRDAAGSPDAAHHNHVAELATLAELREHGSITDEEFQRAKDKVLA